MSQPLAVYIHCPFCPSKCGYCDFNSYAMNGEIIERTVRATVQQIQRSPWRGRRAKTVFFGGGTPTVYSSNQLERILSAVLESHPLEPDAEVTSEANPGTSDLCKFNDMRTMGFNRLSLGAQSFHSEDLIRLGRVHGALEIGKAVSQARLAGFDNLNLDLMFALPGQSAQAWRNNLKLAFQMEPEHLSLYCLTIEENTRYYRLHLRGFLDLPDEQEQLEQFDLAYELAAESGYEPYEISNFARPGFECQHNLAYWRAKEYAGYGPGAVARVGASRVTALKHPERYCEAIEGGFSSWFDEEVLTTQDLETERLMLGMRLSQGLPVSTLAQEKVRAVIERGWAEISQGQLRLNRMGRHVANQVVLALI